MHSVYLLVGIMIVNFLIKIICLKLLLNLTLWIQELLKWFLHNNLSFCIVWLVLKVLNITIYISIFQFF